MAEKLDIRLTSMDADAPPDVSKTKLLDDLLVSLALDVDVGATVSAESQSKP